MSSLVGKSHRLPENSLCPLKSLRLKNLKKADQRNGVFAHSFSGFTVCAKREKLLDFLFG